MLAQDMRKLLNIVNESLTEAPISDFQVHGDFSQPGTFRHEDDRKLLSSPKAREKIVRMFEKTPFDFVIHAVNLPHANQENDPYSTAGYGLTTNKDLKNKLGISLPPAKPHQIRIIYRANEGGDRVPLTGWIVSHRFWHAVENGITNYTRLLIEPVWHALDDLKVHADTEHPDYQAKAGLVRNHLGVVPDDMYHNNTIMGLLGKMASARQGRVAGRIDFVHECCSQWLIAGSVRLNRVAGIPEEKIETLEAVFNERVPAILRECQGRTFVI